MAQDQQPDSPNPKQYCCNICGTLNRRPPGGLEREGSSCARCGSSVRLRGLALLLSRELAGVELPLTDLPELRGLRGLGMSDLDSFALPLARKFTYANTYFHQPPRFDVTRPDEREFGRYDFITSSEILEHVPPPAERSFENLAKMLVPGGVLLFTVPYGTTQPGREHFPSLRDSAVVDLGGEWVLVNRARDGTVETFRDLVFHGGDGSTLEMRVYTEARLRGLLADAGFTDIRIAGEPYAPFGVEYRDAWSLPIAARKGQGPGRAACFDELALRYSETFAKLAASHAEFNLLRGEYSKHVGWAEAKVAELEAESRERLDHAARVEKEFEERTAWALSLQADLQAAESAEASARAESEAAKAESAAAREQLESARARLEQNDRQLFVRILKKLGLIRA